jgi:5'-methylthioadenosine phosphorylase
MQGVVKFNCHWNQSGPVISDEQYEIVNYWREILYNMDLIGAYENGVGFGNISMRIRGINQFVITGSATGEIPELEPGHYVKVSSFNIDDNAVQCVGPLKASSESLTHAAMEEIRRGDLVIPDQFIDFTRHRDITFFEDFEPGTMNHTPMADPFDKGLRELIISTAGKAGLLVHEKGTLITIEGPRFSTRAESRMFRCWGADVINMSVAPEATLANEIGIPYAAIAMSTDYDCWKEDEVPVSWEEVIAVFKKNVDKVLTLLVKVIAEVK